MQSKCQPGQVHHALHEWHLIPKEISKADIKTKETSKLSPMMPGLLNTLTQEEILDLLAYFQAAGKPEGAAFKK